jgi:hypothetical protein
VCDQETSKKEEAKADNRAVENTTSMGCNARKTSNKQTNKQHVFGSLHVIKNHIISS